MRYGQPLARAGRRFLARRARRVVGRQRDRQPRCWPRSSPGSRRRPTRPIISTASRPTACIANLLAMPVVSAWVMPMGILGVLAMPFGFDAEFWRQMGYGIEWMDTVALVGREPARRVRPRDRVRHRTALARDGWSAADRAAQDAAALERGGLRRAGSRARRRARRCRMCSWPPTAGPSRCAARTADSPSITPAAIRLRRASGLRPMPMAAIQATKD